MNTNFMEKKLINKCATVLGISAKDVASMFEMNKETSSFIRRRINYGLYNVEDNIGLLLKGLLMRDIKDQSSLKDSEIDFIKDRYGIFVECSSSKNFNILSERVDPLVLGVTGETLLREYARVLGISRKDAVKLVKTNEQVKSFLKRENSLILLNKNSCISVLLQNTLNRDKNNFDKITENEIMSIYKKYGILVGALKCLNYKSLKQ